MQIFLDFDGTVSTVDTTDLVLSRLARPGWLAAEAEWEAGAIGSAECMARQAALIDASPAGLDAVAAEVRLRPGLRELVRWAARRGYLLAVVSDGLDRVIRAVLTRHGLVLPVVANRLVAEGARGWRLEQPHARPGCGQGVCKCAVLAAAGAERGPAVFVGDGRSDFCAAARLSPGSDLLFATGRLAAYAAERGIPFLPFDDFRQVLAALEAAEPSLSLAA